MQTRPSQPTPSSRRKPLKRQVEDIDELAYQAVLPLFPLLLNDVTGDTIFSELARKAQRFLGARSVVSYSFDRNDGSFQEVGMRCGNHACRLPLRITGAAPLYHEPVETVGDHVVSVEIPLVHRKQAPMGLLQVILDRPKSRVTGSVRALELGRALMRAFQRFVDAWHLFWVYKNFDVDVAAAERLGRFYARCRPCWTPVSS